MKCKISIPERLKDLRAERHLTLEELEAAVQISRSALGRDVYKRQSKDCPTCRESYPAQAFLVCVNTGETYSLDVYHMDENPDDEYGGMRLSFGYDEISEANIHVTTYPGEQYGYAEIYRGRRIVSAHKMKSVFCDDCIRERCV